MDTWLPISTVGAPSPRYNHGAVWTGSRMVLWGGLDGDSIVQTGGLYDPVTDSWLPTSLNGAPTGRSGFAVVWTGSRVLIWGGAESPYPIDGAIYDPVADTWFPMSTVGAPTARAGPLAVWDRWPRPTFGNLPITCFWVC